MTTFSPYSINLVSSSHQLPNEPITNQQLLTALSHQCGNFTARKAAIIAKKLGINSRHLVRSLEQALSQPTPSAIELSQLCIQQALNLADLEVNSLCYLISHTCTPHTQVPPNAAWLADKLAFQGSYLELRQACTGFANGLQIAAAFCHGHQQPCAIIGCETGSVYFELSPQFIDQQQLINYMQMGDGAGAVIVTPAHSKQALISDIYLGQIGHQRQPGFYLDGGSNNTSTDGLARFHHDARGVKQHGSQLFQLGLNAILSRGYHLDDFAYILPHQANGHIDKMLAQALNIDPMRIINDAKSLGNLGSAAIWVSLSRLLGSGKLSRGDKVLVLGAEATKYLYGGFVYQH